MRQPCERRISPNASRLMSWCSHRAHASSATGPLPRPHNRASDSSRARSRAAASSSSPAEVALLPARRKLLGRREPLIETATHAHDALGLLSGVQPELTGGADRAQKAATPLPRAEHGGAHPDAPGELAASRRSGVDTTSLYKL